MRRKSTTPYLVLLGAVLMLISLPVLFSEKARGMAISIAAPLLEPVYNAKLWLKEGPLTNNFSSEEKNWLMTENERLKNEVAQLEYLLETWQELEEERAIRLDQDADYKSFKALSARAKSKFKHLLKMRYMAKMAKIVFRSPSSWNSTFWINLGKENGIVKNSPVVVGEGIVGVVDFVGDKQSRVRLITDSALTPSVRVVRGYPAQANLKNQLQSVYNSASSKTHLFDSNEQAAAFLKSLENFEKRLLNENEGLWLAKGELQGSAKPLWHAKGQKLKGVAFNYDFDDEEGPARDLTSAQIKNEEGKTAPRTLIEEGDLLLTTGMDGVFPEGLKAAYVTYVHPLNEGDFGYSIEAEPAAGNFDELYHVLVLPPIGYDPLVKPSPAWKSVLNKGP